jgi:hypothetical protein
MLERAEENRESKTGNGNSMPNSEGRKQIGIVDSVKQNGEE